MKFVSLDRYPNQSFTLIEGNIVITFTLMYFRGLTFVTVIDSEGTTVVTSFKASNKAWIFPKKYETYVGANYRFEDDNDEYPVYSNFNKTCVLTRYTTAEAAAQRTEEGC